MIGVGWRRLRGHLITSDEEVLVVVGVVVALECGGDVYEYGVIITREWHTSA